MEIQTLVVTMNRQDHSLAETMNLQTDAIIGNQADREEEECFDHNGNQILFLTDTGRGAARNRNRVLERATAEICVFADDDMRFLDGYPETVEKAFLACPDADILVFNLVEQKPGRFVNQRFFPVTVCSYARYGGARIAVRRRPVIDSGVRFPILFGGGAEYGSGEDTIFLLECLKKGLKIMAVPYALAEIDQSAPSTWFHGYDRKFFRDKGALYTRLYGQTAPVFCGRFLVKYRRKYRDACSGREAWRAMMAGMREFRAREEHCR